MRAGAGHRRRALRAHRPAPGRARTARSLAAPAALAPAHRARGRGSGDGPGALAHDAGRPARGRARLAAPGDPLDELLRGEPREDRGVPRRHHRLLGIPPRRRAPRMGAAPGPGRGARRRLGFDQPCRGAGRTPGAAPHPRRAPPGRGGRLGGRARASDRGGLRQGRGAMARRGIAPLLGPGADGGDHPGGGGRGRSPCTTSTGSRR